MTIAINIPRRLSYPGTATQAPADPAGIGDELGCGGRPYGGALYAMTANPGEIYALESGALRKLTKHNDALMAELNLVPTEGIEFKSKDGTEVHGLLTQAGGIQSRDRRCR